jgi:hypothetical protein
LVAIVALIQSRPLAELVSLSDKYASATTQTERLQYLAAGESLHALFNGTGWVMYTILGGISMLINSLLMLRSKDFSKVVVYLGIIDVIGSLGIFLPVVGVPLSLLATFGGVVWSVLIAQVFFKLARGKPNAVQAAS